MKKAQIEIAGLLIVVVLVTITLLFLLTFRVNNSDNQIPVEQETRDTYIRDRFSQVLFETNTECGGRTIKELLSDCGYSNNINCDTLNSCQFVNYTIESIINETLNFYGIEYVITVTAKDNLNKKITYLHSSGCDLDTAKKVTPFYQPAETDFGGLLFNFTQCD